MNLTMNSTIIEKDKKKREKKKRSEEENQIIPGIELVTLYAPGCFVTTTPRATHSENIDNILLKPFPLGLPPARPV